MGYVVMPYDMVSESGKILANKLRCLRIKREASKYKYKEGHVVINWGCPVRPAHIPEDAVVVNKFEAVALASNKKNAFRTFINKGVSTVSTTESKDEAKRWIAEGYSVVARTILNGHGGAGIVIIDNLDDFIDAPLYTLYMPKKSEWRVHVFNGGVIDVTRKVLREDYPDKENVNWKVRNHENGFIFQRYNARMFDDDGQPMKELFLIPQHVRNNALKAVKALGLDFGAVDIIYNEKKDRSYVLEVNTAPGIADTTSDIYADYFINALHTNAFNRVALPEMKRGVPPLIENPFAEFKLLAVDEAPLMPPKNDWPAWPRPKKVAAPRKINLVAPEF